jgi:hypothetical protein
VRWDAEVGEALRLVHRIDCSTQQTLGRNAQKRGI